MHADPRYCTRVRGIARDAEARGQAPSTGGTPGAIGGSMTGAGRSGSAGALAAASVLPSAVLVARRASFSASFSRNSSQLVVEQRLELVLVDRLALDEHAGHQVELRAPLGQDRARLLVRLVDEPRDLLVDLVGDLGRVVRVRREVPPEEHLVVGLAERLRAELLAHAEARDHLLGELGGPLDVVAGTGGDVADRDLLGDTAAEDHGEVVEHLAAWCRGTCPPRAGQRVAERAAARDDRDLVDRVGVGQHVADERVTGLVVRDDLLLLVGDQAALALRTGDDAVDGLFELDHVDLLLAVTRGEQRGLVDEVGEVGAGEARRAASEHLEVDVVGQAACHARGS